MQLHWLNTTPKGNKDIRMRYNWCKKKKQQINNIKECGLSFKITNYVPVAEAGIVKTSYFKVV